MSRPHPPFAARLSGLWNRSVRRQLILGVALVHAALMTVFVFDLVERQREFLHLEAVRRAESLAGSLAVTSESGVLSKDLAALEEVTHSLVKTPGLEYAMILDPSGRVLGHTDMELVGRFASDPVSLGLLDRPHQLQHLVISPRQIDVASPVFAGTRMLGWARVGLSQSAQRANLAMVTQKGLAYTALAILMGTLMAWYIARRLSSGLDGLVRAVDAVRAGQRDVRADEDRADEIGRLGAGFNAMVQAVLESEKRYRDLVEHAPVGIFQTTLQGRYLMANDRLAEMYGYASAREMVESILDIGADLYVDRRDRENILKTLEQGPVNRVEVRRRRKDRAIIWISLSMRAVLGQDGTPLRYEGFTSDITEAKEAETALIQARDAAEAANKAKSAFLAAVSHEVRTPLNGIMGMLQLISGTPLEPEQVSLVDISLESARKLSTILNDILDLARIETGNMEQRREEFQPYRLMHTVAEIFRADALAKGLDIQVEIDPLVPELLEADEGRLRQILFNLIGNAVKFSSQGTVDIQLSLLPIRDNPNSLTLLFSVRDTGPGIPEDRLGFIFETFTQLDDGLNRQHGGLGLGLPIVKRFVEHLRGALCVDSTPGEGSVFYFTVETSIPAAREIPAPDGPHLPERWASLPSLNVLLVEDDRINQLVGQQVLAHLGHGCQVASNGLEALARLEQEPFDLILMDIQMPTLDGMAAATLIRQSGKGYAGIPIIAVTSHAMKGDRDKFLAAGMDDYVAKPLEIEILRRAIAKVFLGTRAVPHPTVN